MAAGVTPLAKYKLVFLGVRHAFYTFIERSVVAPSLFLFLRAPLPAHLNTHAVVDPTFFFVFFKSSSLSQFSSSPRCLCSFWHARARGGGGGLESCFLKRAIAPENLHRPMLSVSPHSRPSPQHSSPPRPTLPSAPISRGRGVPSSHLEI